MVRQGKKGKRPLSRPKSAFPVQDASTAELEAIVFGQALDLEAVPEEEQAAEAETTETSKVAGRRGKRKRKAAAKSETEPREETPSKPAWVDEDDATFQVDLTAVNRRKKLRRADAEVKVDGNEYEKRLREQFLKIHGTASWAELRPEAADDAGASSDEDGERSAVVASSSKPTSGSKAQRIGAKSLMPETIDIMRRRPVRIGEEGSDKKAAVQHALHFHPDSELMLTAGLDKTLRIFSIDGEENPRISKHFFDEFPITGASFTPDGDQVLLTGMYGEDMQSLDVHTGSTFAWRPQQNQKHRRLFGLTVGPHPSAAPGLRSNGMFSVLGDGGRILVCDARTKFLVRTLQMSMQGVASVFSSDRDVVWSADRDNNIYEWDLGTGRCKQRCKASWATGIWSLALHGVSKNAPTPHLAVGTSSGNIDLYDVSGPKFPKAPTLSFDNLVTRVQGLSFHPEGELLAGFSSAKKEQLKLMHCASGTVYRNWPNDGTFMDTVASVTMSRKRGWLAFGNNKGQVRLYQLLHYE